MDERKLSSLPLGIRIPLLEALYPAHCNPPTGLPDWAYKLIHRSDVTSRPPTNFMSCTEVKADPGEKAPEMPFSSPVLDFRSVKGNMGVEPIV